MPSAIFSGSSDLQEQPKQRTWSAESGWATVRTWEGERSAIDAFANTLTSQGAIGLSVSSSGESPVGRVSATFPDAQDVNLNANPENITWELFGNDLEKDLTTHSSIKPLTDADRNALVMAKDYVVNPPGDTIAEINAAITANLSGKSLKLYQHLSQGTTGYVVTHYVLRKTIKVAGNSAVIASLVGVNKVEAPVGVPGVLFNVPTEQGDGTIQWLKKPPQVQSLGRGKFQIVQEWWGSNVWSKDLYGGASLP